MSSWRKATLADVAQLAGVSGTTVSYILNGRAEEMRISVQTQQRVRAAVAELDYRPNRSARNLRTSGTTKTIGLISDFIASGHFANQMLSGAGAAARRWDHVVVIGETLGDPGVEAEFVDELQDRQVDGFVYARLVTSVITVPAALRGRRTILLNAVDEGAELPSVVHDERAGGATAAEVLVRAGCTGPVVVVGNRTLSRATAGADRIAGIEARLQRAGIHVAAYVSCEWDVAPAYDAVVGLLRSGSPPAALICLNDRIAMGCYQAIADCGLRIPDDVSVVSFDGSDLAGWLRPRLTSVRVPYEAMGVRAVDLLMSESWATAGLQRVSMPLAPGASVRPRAPASRTHSRAR